MNIFAIIITYGRLSTDSEIVAFKSAGYSMTSILLPAVIFAIIISYFSAQTSFHMAPWGNRKFELLITKVGQTRAGVSLKEGTFSEGFFDLVIYANQVDSKKGELEKVFIYDERGGDIPLTIISKKGQIIQDINHPGHSVLLRLSNGDIHRKSENHTKIKFDSFDIKLFDPIKEETKEKSPLSMSLEEVQVKLNQPNITAEDKVTFGVEFHKRWAISLVCPIFALLGVGLATSSNRRNQKSSGLIVSLLVVIFYWIIYVTAEGIARSGKVSPHIAIWTPNLVFLFLGIYFLKRNWN